MPRKKKILSKNLTVHQDVETSDDQIEESKRTLRSRVKSRVTPPQSINRQVKRNKKTPNDHKKQQQPTENGYDADSELEQQLDSATDSDTDGKSMAVSTDSENDLDLKKTRAETKESEVFPGSTYGDSQCAPANKIIDKENFTPPDSHSTPSFSHKVVRNLDDSLFGFNRLESPLPYSPLSSISSRGRPSPSRSLKATSFSAKTLKGKRKSEQIFDFPQEERKGKKKKTKQESKIDDNLEELREQFKEVEMHELVVEYD